MENRVVFPSSFFSRHKLEKEEDNSLKEIWGSSILKGEGTPMNVKVDSQNVIPFPQVELRPGKREGADLNAFAVRESFGEILEREFQIHSEGTRSAPEWKPLHAEKSSYESYKESDSQRETENRSNTIKEDVQKVSETSVQKNKENEMEETEEEELDRDAIEYSIHILSNHSLFEKNFIAANETNESQKKEKTS